MAANSLRADGPLKLIQTPNATTGSDDVYTMDASHMALVHNMMIRSFNSIYLQAPRVKPADVPDFLHYCDAFHHTVKGHHDGEEQCLFPEIEKATGVKGIMDEDIQEHHRFYGSLDQLREYLDKCLADTSQFNGDQLVELLDGFGPTLQTHLMHEPPRLVELAKYKIDMTAISNKTAEWTRSRTSMTDVFPMLWYNLDKDFEGGKWAQFPEVPAPIKWVMINMFGWWRSNWWRFGSSGADGYQRDLLCLTPAY